jgi:uncharacterized protein YlxW (UPF0749 family)
MKMSNRTFIPLCVVCALMATSAFAAATQPSTGNQPPPQLRKIPPTPTDAQLILNNTTELLKQVAALTKEVNSLTTTVNSLTKAQSAEAAMVADMANRLQATCHLLGAYQMTINSNYGVSWCWGRTHPNPADVEGYSPFGTW